MPIRGTRNPMPKSGGTPTGIFKQPQKMDPVDGPERSTLAYAHSAKGRSAMKTTSGGKQGMRHQPPKRK